jgi:hypothetical protein
MIKYEDWLVHKELEEVQMRTLIKSFKNGSYWKSNNSINEQLWHKLRKGEK